ncbi:MAG: NADH-quinone oxidoreductase subunit NuoI [Nitrospiraceae bacterium]|nr:NADH-quinone oxidoreductase subunit NuoI [Nitrospiraceae bacterium]
MNTKKIVKTIFMTEILQGMALTLKSLFSPAVTRQYPKEKRQPFPGFRGQHAFVRDAKTGKEKCIACGLCGAVCPSKCIYIYTKEDEETRKKTIDRYEIELLRCVYCAFCVEACPVGAIALTENYEYSDYSREALYMTKEKLLDNWDRFMAGPKGDEYFEKFWTPKQQSFRAHDDQAVFRPKGSNGAARPEADTRPEGVK